jgi:hypothetical protein
MKYMLQDDQKTKKVLDKIDHLHQNDQKSSIKITISIIT